MSGEIKEIDSHPAFRSLMEHKAFTLTCLTKELIPRLLSCNDKARLVFNISPRKMLHSGVDFLFQIKFRAVQGHSSLPKGDDPSALGELLDLRARRAATFSMPDPT